MSILEDYDHDAAEIQELESDISKLCSTFQIVEQYGAPKSAIKLLCVSDLLNTTSRLALESLEDDSAGLESVKTKQSILDTIKEKSAQWSSKIIAYFKDKSANFFSRIEKLWDTFKAKLPVVKDKLSKLTNDSKTYVKSHPYKTVAMALAACISVMSIISFTGRMLPTVTNSKAMTKFTSEFTKQVSAIKWPFGEITTKVASGGKKVIIGVAGVGAVGGLVKLAQLGWSKVTAEQLDRGLEKVCGGLEKTWTTLAPKVTTIGKTAVDLVKNSFSAASSGFSIGYNVLINERENKYPVDITEKEILMETAQVGLGGIMAAGTVVLFWGTSIIYGLYKLMSVIVGGTIRLCVDTIHALSHPTDKQYV